jgi:hypothetical protein
MSKAHEQYQAGEQEIAAAYNAQWGEESTYHLQKAQAHFLAAAAAAQIHTAGYAAQIGGQR